MLKNAANKNSLILSQIGDSLRDHPELRLTQADVEERIADLIIDYQRSYTMVQSDLFKIIMERDLANVDSILPRSRGTRQEWHWLSLNQVH